MAMFLAPLIAVQRLAHTRADAGAAREIGKEMAAPPDGGTAFLQYAASIRGGHQKYM
jgi:hypothetical protein